MNLRYHNPQVIKRGRQWHVECQCGCIRNGTLFFSCWENAEEMVAIIDQRVFQETK